MNDLGTEFVVKMIQTFQLERLQHFLGFCMLGIPSGRPQPSDGG